MTFGFKAAAWTLHAEVPLIHMIWKKADQELPKRHRVDMLLSIFDHGKCCTGKSFLLLFPFFLILIGKSSHTRLKFITQCVIMVHAFFFILCATEEGDK